MEMYWKMANAVCKPGIYKIKKNSVCIYNYDLRASIGLLFLSFLELDLTVGGGVGGKDEIYRFQNKCCLTLIWRCEVISYKESFQIRIFIWHFGACSAF